MKKGLRNAVAYFVLARAFYVAAASLGTPVGFYAMLLFFMIHLIGISIVNLFVHAFLSPDFLQDNKTLFIVAIVSINSAIVYGLTAMHFRWSRRP